MIRWIKSLFPLAIRLGKELRKQYDNLSDKQKDELMEKVKEYIENYIKKNF